MDVPSYVLMSYDEEQEYLQSVNSFWNRFSNKAGASDKLVWGVEDYWATPKETLDKKAGDCDDVAIGKMWNLVQAGFPSENLALAYALVSPKTSGLERPTELAHMVTFVVTKKGEVWVLDNMLKNAMPYSEAQQLQNYYVHYRLMGIPDNPQVLNWAGRKTSIQPKSLPEFKSLLERWSEMPEFEKTLSK